MDTLPNFDLRLREQRKALLVSEETLSPSEIHKNRLKKLEKLREQGYDPYSLHFAPEHRVADLLEIESKDFSEKKHFSIAGRIRSARMMGKAAFCDLEDHEERIQLYASKDSLGDSFTLFRDLDLGDIIGVNGFLFKTRTGQTTLHLKNFTLLAKCLRPLPVVKEAQGKVYDAFADREQRYRQRYVDLIVNPGVRKSFILRSQVIAQIRDLLIKKGYIEVETPIMQAIPGGAAARPFTTHHNTLEMDLYLRVAPELYLKRLIVGGFAKVFEIGPNFRNEGISPKHNPEFTMLELYEAYGSIESMRTLCEELITSIIENTLEKQKQGKNLEIQYGEEKLNFKRPWRRLGYLDSIEEFADLKFNPRWELAKAREAAYSCSQNKKDEKTKAAPKITKTELQACDTIWQVAELLFDRYVEPALIQPTFIENFPRELSPLAKSWPEKAETAQRFEPYAAGREIGNAFSELNDPLEQRRRFIAQVEERKKASEAGAAIDEDYLRALEYGMPPTGGLGIGIDRLLMLLNNTQSIRDTILFPLLRPEQKKSK